MGLYTTGQYKPIQVIFILMDNANDFSMHWADVLRLYIISNVIREWRLHLNYATGVSTK